MLETGRVLQQRYRVESALGHGGMGGVYLVRDLQLDTMFALKQMDLGLVSASDRAAAVRLFKQEAHILHELNHPRLPRMHDFVEDEGTVFLVMDYIRGVTLSEVLKERGPLDEGVVWRWGLDLAGVLDYLHGQNIIFRDLKPANVMLDSEGAIKLIDFGISKVFRPDQDSQTITYARGLVSPGFAALEQYSTTTDARSDIYSLGATLYNLLTGLTPPPSVERAAGTACMPSVLEARPQTWPHFAAAIDAMLQIRADDRPATIQEVLRLLHADPAAPPPLSLPDAITVTAPSVAVPAPPPSGRRRHAPLRAGAVAVGLALVVMGGMWRTRPPVAVRPAEVHPPVPAATLRIRVYPNGADLYVNGALHDARGYDVPSSFPVKVKLRKAGYVPIDTEIVAMPPGHLKVYRLVRSGGIRFTSNTATSVVLRGCRQRIASFGTDIEVPSRTARLPTSMDRLPPGKYAFVLQGPGMLDQEDQVSVGEGRLVNVHQELHRAVVTRWHGSAPAVHSSPAVTPEPAATVQ